RPQNLLQVVAHEIEAGLEKRLPGRLAVRGMDRELRGRQAEDQPAMADIDRGEAQDVAEEGAVRLRIRAVEEDVGTCDQGEIMAHEPGDKGSESARVRRRPPLKAKVRSPSLWRQLPE